MLSARGVGHMGDWSALSGRGWKAHWELVLCVNMGNERVVCEEAMFFQELIQMGVLLGEKLVSNRELSNAVRVVIRTW